MPRRPNMEAAVLRWPADDTSRTRNDEFRLIASAIPLEHRPHLVAADGNDPIDHLQHATCDELIKLCVPGSASSERDRTTTKTPRRCKRWTSGAANGAILRSRSIGVALLWSTFNS